MIEVWRQATGTAPLAPEFPAIRALASDQGDGGTGLPVFAPDDIPAMADFILRETGLDKVRRRASSMPPGVDWTPVDQVLDRLRAGIRPIDGALGLPLWQAAGHVLARLSHPPRPNSAVDGCGYAFGTVDFAAGPVPLAMGRAAAGQPWPGVLSPGEALRILTGAILPPGVDTVALQEHAQIEQGPLTIAGAPARREANTRAAGEGMAAGAVALRAGTVLRAQEIGLAAALGIASLRVRPRLRVGVLSTGEQLVGHDTPELPAGAIPDANRPMLLAALARLGFVPVDLGICRDWPDDLLAALDGAIGRVDSALTSGGASQGDEDHVSPLLRAEPELRDWCIGAGRGAAGAGVWSAGQSGGGDGLHAGLCRARAVPAGRRRLARAGWVQCACRVRTSQTGRAAGISARPPCAGWPGLGVFVRRVGPRVGPVMGGWPGRTAGRLCRYQAGRSGLPYSVARLRAVTPWSPAAVRRTPPVE